MPGNLDIGIATGPDNVMQTEDGENGGGNRPAQRGVSARDRLSNAVQRIGHGGFRMPMVMVTVPVVMHQAWCRRRDAMRPNAWQTDQQGGDQGRPYADAVDAEAH